MSLLNIERLLENLALRRKVFVSEADIQLELGMLIKEEYPSALVRLEYSPKFNPSMHIDIVVKIDNRLIPIELKYKTKSSEIEYEGEYYLLKNHGAKDVNCYAYLKDIQRIEEVREAIDEFGEGYTIFLTNDLTYTKKPERESVFYREFCINEGSIKTGRMKWDFKASEGTKKGHEKDIVLQGVYPVHWKTYSVIDDKKNRYIYIHCQ